MDGFSTTARGSAPSGWCGLVNPAQQRLNLGDLKIIDRQLLCASFERDAEHTLESFHVLWILGDQES